MTRIPTITDVNRVPGRVGVPAATLNLPGTANVRTTGSLGEVLGQGIQRLAAVLRQAHAARILTSFEASSIEGIGQAELDAGKVDPALSEETFSQHSSLRALQEQISQQSDGAIKNRMSGFLDIQLARGLNRVRRSRARREGIQGKAETENLGDQFLGSIARGMLSSSEAIERFGSAVERHMDTSYTETTGKDALDAFAARAIRHEYQYFLSLDIPDDVKKAAIDDLLGTDIALAVLPADEIANRKVTVDNVQAQRREETLARIRGRAVSFHRSDNIASLKDLLDTLTAMSGPGVDDLAIDVHSRITAIEKTISDAQKLLAGMAADDGTSLPASPTTLNSATRIVQDTTGDTAGFIRQLLENGLDIPSVIQQQIKADAQPATLNMTRFYEQLNIIAAFDTPQAERIARESGPIGQTAFFSTRRLTDPNQIAARLALLGDQSADQILTQVTQLLQSKSGKEPEINLRTEFLDEANITTFTVLPGFPFPLRRRFTVKIAPDQVTELGALFSVHMLEQIATKGTAPEDASAVALTNAISELQSTHQQSFIVGRGLYLLPREALEIGGLFEAAQASNAVVNVAAAMLRDAGPQSDFLPSRPIIDERNSLASWPVTGPSGITGFVEYDGSTGLSRRITASTDPKTFAQLQRRIAGRPPEQLAPHQDLTRHGQQQVMTDQISDSFVDMAFEIFRAGNDGRLPDLTSDVDRATVEAIVNGLAGQAKWNEP